MPKQLTDYSFNPYDWDLLLDGRIWRCEPGVDFGRKGVDLRCTPQAFASKVRAAARSKDRLPDLRIEVDGAVIVRARLKPVLRPKVAL